MRMHSRLVTMATKFPTVLPETKPMATETPKTSSKDSEEALGMVFAGSSDEDVCHARIFWNSVTLQPALESRLVSGDIRQRLRVAPPPSTQINITNQLQLLDDKIEQILLEYHKDLKADEKTYYLEKAKKREEILALLRKQREERLKKEQISIPHKPKITTVERRPVTSDQGNEDLEAVKALPDLY